MKLSTLVVCLGTMAMAIAAASSFRVTLFEKAAVAGTELKPGDYKVDLNGETARFTLGNKMMVEARVKVETDSNKFDKTSVRYANAGGKYTVQEIRLGGTSTRLVFSE